MDKDTGQVEGGDVAETSFRLEVSGVPRNVLADDLVDFFECQSLTGSVTVSEFSPSSSTACLNLSCHEDIDALLCEETFKYAGGVLTVYRPKVKTQVKVTGFSKTCCHDILLYFFQNKRRGGDIELLELDSDAQTAIITFKEHKDAVKIVKASPFKRGGDIMTVHWYTEDMTRVQRRVVAIYGVPSYLDKEDLEDRAELQDIRDDIEHIAKEEYRFLVTVSSQKAVDTLLNLKTLLYEENILENKRVKREQEAKTHVLIRGLPANCEKELIKLFFQNKKKSVGGPIKSFDIDEKALTAHVVFCYETDACNVVHKREFKKQNGTTFYAEWHRERDTDPKTITLCHSYEDINLSLVEEFLEEKTGEKVTEMRSRNSNLVEITFESQEGPKMVLRLEQEGKLVIGPSTSPLRCLGTTEPISGYVSVKVRTVKHFTGDTDEYVRNAALSEPPAERKTANIAIDEMKYELLNGTHCLDSIKRKYTDLDVKVTPNKVVLEGYSSEVQTGQMEIRNLVSNIKCFEPPWCSANVITFLSDKTVAEKMISRYKDVFIHVYKGTKLVLCGNDNEQFERLRKEMEKEISEIDIPPKQLDKSVLAAFEHFLLDLKTEMKNEFIFSREQRDEIVFAITGYKSCVQKAKLKIEKFLNANKRLEEFVTVEKAHGSLLRLHPKMVSDIEAKWTVDIKINQDNPQPGIMVCGIQENISKAKEQITVEFKDVITEVHPVTSPVMVKHYLKQEDNFFQPIAIECQVAIHAEVKEKKSTLSDDANKTLDYTQWFGTGHLNAAPTSGASNYENTDMRLTTDSRQTFIPKLTKGMLTDSKADVIVNSTRKNLELDVGSVSASILRVGGKSIQDQCEQWTKKHAKELEPFVTIVTTGGGQLNCKAIYHTSLGQKINNYEQSLKDLVWRCLEQASKDGHKSIAFPSLGTGNLGYPRNLVAAVMLETSHRFRILNQDTCLQQVEIVLFPQDTETIKEFEAKAKELRSSLGPSKDEKSLSYKGINLEFKQDDITNTTTEAIVYTTDTTFSHGSTIAKRILALDDGTFVNECRTGYFHLSILFNLCIEIQGLKTTWKKGVAVTSGSFLGCQYIIHINAPHTWASHNWKENILNCLQEAERLKIASIALPAIGTGILKVSLSDIAMHMVDGIMEFASSGNPKHVKTIEMVIFKPRNVEEFEELIKKELESHGPLDTGVDDQVEKDCTTKTEVNLVITAFKRQAQQVSEAKIRLVNKLAEGLKEKRMDETADSEDIYKLTDKQVIEIKKAAKRQDVTIEVVKKNQLRGNRIVLQGHPEAVSAVAEFVHKQFREAAKQKEKEQLFENVKWQWQGNDGYLAYSIDANYLLEEAYNNDVNEVTVTKNGKTVHVDIKNLTERTTDDKITQIRRNEQVSVPVHWSPMSDAERYTTVELSSTDKNTKAEYSRVANHFKKSMKSKSIKIQKITRIQNPLQHQRYDNHAKHMSTANEQPVLWHGTHRDTIDPIMANGFDRAYAGKNGIYYGKGVYFAKSAAYSHSFAIKDKSNLHNMFQCKVLVGEYTKGETDYTTTPPKDPANPTNKYDSVVDSVSNPTMFVIFSDTQAYPEYLITYKM